MTTTREVGYQDIVTGMHFLCGGHGHEILSVKAYAPGPAGNGKRRRARKELWLSVVHGCPENAWTCEPGDTITCATEPNTDAVDTQPIAMSADGIFSGAREYERRSAAKARTLKDTHTIPAREAVPGMLVEIRPGAGDWTQLRKVGRDEIGLLVWMYGGGTYHCPPGYPTDVRLPGQSPRELCCTCGDWYPYAKASDDPSVHLRGDGLPGIVCPVAPVTGVHGGMRLWPAPLKGHAWVAVGQDSWKCGIPGGCTVYSRDLVGLWTGLAPWVRDVGLASFFLPPMPAPDTYRRIPGPLADDAELEMVAARVGRGEVKAVRR